MALPRRRETRAGQLKIESALSSPVIFVIKASLQRLKCSGVRLKRIPHGRIRRINYLHMYTSFSYSKTHICHHRWYVPFDYYLVNGALFRM